MQCVNLSFFAEHTGTKIALGNRVIELANIWAGFSL